MNNSIINFICCLFVCLSISGCGSGQKYEPTITKTPTFKVAPTQTVTLTTTVTATSTPTMTITPTIISQHAKTTIPEGNILLDQNFENGEIGYWRNRSSNPLEIRTESNNSFLHFTATGDIRFPGFWNANLNNNGEEYIFESKIRIHESGLMVCFFRAGRSLFQDNLEIIDSLDSDDYLLFGKTCMRLDDRLASTNDQWDILRIETKHNGFKLSINDKTGLSHGFDNTGLGGIGFYAESKEVIGFDMDDIRVWLIQ